MLPKINVFLIDDNPEFALQRIAELQHLPLGMVPSPEFGAVRIPAVFDDTGLEFRFPELDEFFNLQWLQLPEDVKEYRNFSLELLHRDGPPALSRLGVCPDIVCFDYALSGAAGRDFNLPEAVLSPLLPNVRLAEFLKKTPNRKSPPNEAMRVPSTGAEHNKDNMGCYSGGLIVTQFIRQHPVAAIPTTRKNKDTIENKEANFFAWLLEEEFENTFRYLGRPIPKWHEMITQAVGILRLQTRKLSRVHQINIDLHELMNYAAGQIPLEKENRVFTFWSVYGRKQWPLDGLFMDVPAGEVREEKIKAWADELLDELLSPLEHPQANEHLRHAIKFSEDLFEVYSDRERVLSRVSLSHLVSRQKNGHVLSQEDQIKLKTLKDYFQVSEKEEVMNYFELRSCKLGNQRTVKRWVVLFTMVRLYHLFVKRRKKPGDFSLRDERFRFLFAEPEKIDYLLALFPIAKNPIVLPIHRTDNNATDNFEKELDRNAGVRLADILSLDDTHISKEKPQNFFVANQDAEDRKNETTRLKPAEKRVLQRFALSIGFDDVREWPHWLRIE